MDATIRRKVIAALNAEREAAEARLEQIRKLKTQIALDEAEAMRAVNESHRRVREISNLIYPE